MNTKNILENEWTSEFDDRKYCIETLELLTEIRDRQTKLLDKINELNNLWDDNERLKQEHYIISAYNRDSWLIKHGILECTDKLLLESIRWQIIWLLEQNRVAFISTWEQ